MSLNGLDTVGSTVRLWLTARLLNRLVLQCSEWAAQKGRWRPLRHSPRERPVHTVASRSVSRQVSVESRQQAAVEIPLPPDTAVHLVHSVVFQAVEDSVRLILRNAADLEIAALILTRVELSQWLSLLYRAYLSAGWPVTHWPGWLSGQEDHDNGAGLPSRRVFH